MDDHTSPDEHARERARRMQIYKARAELGVDLFTGEPPEPTRSVAEVSREVGVDQPEADLEALARHDAETERISYLPPKRSGKKKPKPLTEVDDAPDL